MHSAPRLKRLRKAQGLTRQQVANHLRFAGVDAEDIKQWERAEAPIPVHVHAGLADLFGVSASHLLGVIDPDSDWVEHPVTTARNALCLAEALETDAWARSFHGLANALPKRPPMIRREELVAAQVRHVESAREQSTAALHALLGAEVAR